MYIIFHDSSSGITNFDSEIEGFLLAPRMFFTQHVHVNTYSSLQAVIAQPQNCPFGVHVMTELENVTTSSNNGIQRVIFQLTSLPIFLDAVVIVLNSIVVLTPNDNFWVVPLLHSANAKTLQKQDDIVTTHKYN